MPEYRLQFFQLQRRRHPEHASAVKTTIRDQNMTMGVEAQEVAEGLDGDDGAGERIIFRDDILYEDLQRLPGAAAQAMQETAIVKEEAVAGSSGC